jgi:ABC-2 type transport system ATP-binding protein
VTPVLQYDGISKQYGGLVRRALVALNDFSLAIEPGEIFGFLGPNGAGKTTAIHLAMGFMRATRGRGQMLGRAFGHAATRRRVGFLAENVALYHRPAARLVRFYGALNGLRDPQLARATRDVLDILELTDVEERNVGKFSRGMLQRVGLAQALVNDPELLILDEPTSALDPRRGARNAAAGAPRRQDHFPQFTPAVGNRVALRPHRHPAPRQAGTSGPHFQLAGIE